MAERFKVQALERLYAGGGVREANERFVVDEAEFEPRTMLKLPDQDADIFSDRPEVRQARQENAIAASRAFGETLAAIGADPTATAEAVGKPAPKADLTGDPAEDDRLAEARAEAERLTQADRDRASVTTDANAIGAAALAAAQAATAAAVKTADQNPADEPAKPAARAKASTGTKAS